MSSATGQKRQREDDDVMVATMLNTADSMDNDNVDDVVISQDMFTMDDAQTVTPSIVSDGTSSTTAIPSLTGRPPHKMFLTCDADHLSPYQVLVRRHVELFEAQEIDVISGAQGRNRPVVLGQVGIRCVHCAHLLPANRTRGAVYYPSKLLGVYQAAQNLANTHLCSSCPHVPPDVRNELCALRDAKLVTSSTGGGKEHWARATEVMGVMEDDYGLRYTLEGFRYIKH